MEANKQGRAAVQIMQRDRILTVEQGDSGGTCLADRGTRDGTTGSDRSRGPWAVETRQSHPLDQALTRKRLCSESRAVMLAKDLVGLVPVSCTSLED